MSVAFLSRSGMLNAVSNRWERRVSNRFHFWAYIHFNITIEGIEKNINWHNIFNLVERIGSHLPLEVGDTTPAYCDIAIDQI